jgi:hypothetical protein
MNRTLPKIITSTLVPILLIHSRPARAEAAHDATPGTITRPTELGHRGTVASTLGIGLQTFSHGTGDDSSTTQVGFVGTANDLFATDRITFGIGATAYGFHRHFGGASQLGATFAPAARFGIFLPISDRFAAWPVASIGASFTVGDQPSSPALHAEIAARFTYALTPTWFLSIAPVTVGWTHRFGSSAPLGLVGAAHGSALALGAAF